MKALSQEQFNYLITQVDMKPRLKSELRFVASTAGMTSEDWHEAELLSIANKSGNGGVLLLTPDDNIYVIPYELSRGITNRQTGRAQPIICDFCRTWQAGNNAGGISFKKDKRSVNSVSFLCCADLKCSQHVRGKTNASRVSKAQLREDLVNEQRVERLKARLRQIIADLQIQSVSLHSAP